jgi:hypothetical protein
VACGTQELTKVSRSARRGKPIKKALSNLKRPLL